MECCMTSITQGKVVCQVDDVDAMRDSAQATDELLKRGCCSPVGRCETPINVLDIKVYLVGCHFILTVCS